MYSGEGTEVPYNRASLYGALYTESLGENGEFNLYFPEYPGNNSPENDSAFSRPVVNQALNTQYDYNGMLTDLEHHITQLIELKYDYSNFDDVLMKDWLYLKVSNPLIETEAQCDERGIGDNNLLPFLPTLAKTGIGKDFTIHVEIQDSQIIRSRILIANAGTGYAIDDIVLTNGHLLMYKHPVNELLLKIKEVNLQGGVVDFDVFYSNIPGKFEKDEVRSKWPYYYEVYRSIIQPYVEVPEWVNDIGYSRLADTYLLFVLDQDPPDDLSQPDFIVRDKWKSKALEKELITQSEGAANQSALIAGTTGDSQLFAQGLLGAPFSAGYQFNQFILIHNDRYVHGPLDPRIVSGIEYLPKVIEAQPNNKFFTEFKITPIRLLLACQQPIRGYNIFYMDSCAYDHAHLFIYQRRKHLLSLYDSRLTFYAANTGSPKNLVTLYYSKIITNEFPNAELDQKYDDDGYKD